MTAVTSSKPALSSIVESIANACRFRFSIDTLLFFGVIIIANLHLLTGDSCRRLIFLPTAFASGDWYRLLTFSFAHVSGYHLALDAGAFLLLYAGLSEKRVHRRLFYVLFCGISSLAAALLFAPLVYTRGLCGLSGIAHGLMAVSALEMMGDRNMRKCGFLFLAVVCGKSICEALTGEVLFSFMHLGLCGSPLAVCHAGGAVGGLAAYLILSGLDRLSHQHIDKQDGRS